MKTGDNTKVGGNREGRGDEGGGKKQQCRKMGGKQGRRDEWGGRGQRNRGNSMIEAMKGVSSQIHTHCQPNLDTYICKLFS